jgi:diguanylate cyclase (GGDEF)-like protein/PAS domain S-box-containing protein
LENIDEVAQPQVSAKAKAEAAYENRLAQVRLGMASSLFVALRARHPRTASHSMRVAMACSSWSILLELTNEVRDELEVAALLHDVGKMGVPDRVLLKPGKLSAEEVMLMNRQRDYAREILSCCAPQEIIDIVYYTSAWYDGRNGNFDRSGEDLPLGSRILSILDAFDAMTTDHVYRRAMSRERAMAELFEYSETQFDPNLVKHFNGFLTANHNKLNAAVSRHWLHELKSTQPDDRWRLSSSTASDPHVDLDRLFHEGLLEGMDDGVVFVDTGLKILKWNRALEVLTGVSASSVEQQQWDPAMAKLRDEELNLIPAEKCPMIHAVRAGVCLRKRLFVADRQGDNRSVNAHARPILGTEGSICGGALLLQDTSSQVTLEERVQSLNEKIKEDALTGTANRAGFDRAHDEFVKTHLERATPYSLIICDLDHFKKINDNFGHQAGDQVLVTFAQSLKENCIDGGLVARYGGEEFVLLCPDYDNNRATALADEAREALAGKSHSALDGKHITASFGVTELQPGDTPDVMLRRADRALLQAKNDGRNTVVQIGVGMTGESEARERHSEWRGWSKDQSASQELCCTMMTAVPLKLAAEKLQGFVFDQGAEILEVEENRVTLEIDGRTSPMTRRDSDRPTPFLVELRFEETRLGSERRIGTTAHRTLVHVAIRLKRNRDRRRGNVDDHGRSLLFSLKSYLMAHEFDGPTE